MLTYLFYKVLKPETANAKLLLILKEQNQLSKDILDLEAAN
jgi:hypothetical protein